MRAIGGYHLCDRGLDDGPSSGEGDDLGVVFGDSGVDVRHRLVAQRNRVESGDEFWQLVFGELTESGQQVEELTELGDAAARPLVPRRPRVFRCAAQVSLEHGDAVAVAGEQQRGEESAEPATGDRDLSQGGRAGRCPVIPHRSQGAIRFSRGVGDAYRRLP